MKLFFKTISLISILIFSSSLLRGQTIYKTYNDTTDSLYSFNKSVWTSDGGMVHVGVTRKNGTSNTTNILLVIKTNAAGQVVWQRNFSQYTSIINPTILNNGNSGYLVFGSKASGNGKQIFVLTLSEIGTLQNLKLYGDPSFANTFDGSVRLNNGNIMLLGRETDSAQATNRYVHKLYKLSSVGDSIWLKRYTQFNGYSTGALIQLSDNGFLMSVDTLIPLNGANQLKSFFLKVDSSGTFVWLKSNLGKPVLKFFKMLDGNILVSSTNSVSRIDEEGTYIWNRLSIQLYPGSNTGRCGSFALTKDGNLVTVSSAGRNNIWTNDVAKINSQGVILWTKSYPTDNPTVGDCFLDVVSNPNDTCFYASGDKIVGQSFKALLFGVNNCATTPTKEIGVNSLIINVLQNPVIDKLHIQIADTPLSINGNFDLFDINGRLVKRHNFSQNEITIERGKLMTGIYFFTIKTVDGRFASGKIVVQ